MKINYFLITLLNMPMNRNLIKAVESGDVDVVRDLLYEEAGENVSLDKSALMIYSTKRLVKMFHWTSLRS